MVPVLFKFYIQSVLKLKKIIPVPKVKQARGSHYHKWGVNNFWSIFYFIIIIIIIIIYLPLNWATCWPVPVSGNQKSLQRSTMIPSASWEVYFVTNAQIAKELKITPILDKLLEYERSWIQHVHRMPPILLIILF